MDIGLSSDTQYNAEVHSFRKIPTYSIQTTMNQQGPGATSGSLQNIDSRYSCIWNGPTTNDGGTFGDMGTLVAGDYILYDGQHIRFISSQSVSVVNHCPSRASRNTICRSQLVP